MTTVRRAASEPWQGSDQAPSLVIFDFDGVLVDSEVMSLEELRATLASYGQDLSLDEVRDRFLGTSLDSVLSFLAERGVDAKGFEHQWHTALFARFRQQLQRIPGVTEALDWLDARDLPYCIASGGSKERLRVALEAVDLAQRFAGRVFSAEQVARGKPHPDLFLLAAETMGVEPRHCLVIEDAPAGVQSAIAAGMRAVGFIGGSHIGAQDDGFPKTLTDLGAFQVLERMDLALIEDLRSAVSRDP